MVTELLVLALDFHRFPLRYRRLADPETPLPRGFDTLLADFCLALTTQDIDAAARTLEVSPKEITDASLFFLRQVLLAPTADCYRVLGLTRSAPQEAVKQHYSLMVRLFHPDRSNDEDERNAAFTVRINRAYNVLRTIDGRRRYDEQLEAQSGDGLRNAPELRDFFHPDEPIRAGLASGKSSFVLTAGTKQIVTWVLVSLLASIFALLVFWPAGKPLLRMDPMLTGKSSLGPVYLRKGLPEPFQPYEAEVPLTDFAQGGATHSTQATENLAGSTMHGDHQIGELRTRARTELTRALDRLSEYYEAGDLDGLVGLFTADAETNGGSGRDHIREQYSELFSRIDRRRLSFTDMRWWNEGFEAISGQGRFRVASMLDGDTDWKDGIGTVHFELVPWNEGYRIIHMIFELEQR